MAIAMVCGLPLLLSLVLSHPEIRWRPATLANRGELLDPPVSLQQVILRDVNGAAYKLGEWGGKWQLLVMCWSLDLVCRHSVEQLRTVRMALGRHILRLDHVLVVARIMDVSGADAALTRYPKARVLSADPRVLQNLSGALGLGGIPPAGMAPTIHLIDPHGSLIMRYAADGAFLDIIADLRRLLKAPIPGRAPRQDAALEH